MNLPISRALVTGGAGFIGSHLVDELVAAGCKVTVVDNLSSGNMANLEHVKNQITFINADMRDKEILTEAANGCDAIFHLAAIVSVPQTIEEPIDSAMINNIGTLHVLEAARYNQVKKVIFSSSCAIYGDDPELPKTEDMIPKPCSHYAVQKLSAEHYLRVYHELYGIQTASLRYFNVYGPRQDPSSHYSGVISIFMTKAASKTAPVIFGDGNQSRDFIYVKDVVNANLLAACANSPNGRTFNIGTGSFVRIKQLWETICRFDGLKIDAAFGPARSGDIVHSVANADRAKSLLHFEADYPFEKGLKLTYQWYKEGPIFVRKRTTPRQAE